MSEQRVIVVIPAFNEEGSIEKVIRDIPGLVEEIVVVNNNSTDNTEALARKAGATVINETQMGYGKACLSGLQYIREKETHPSIIVFMDGDYSDYPEELIQLIEPIEKNQADLVIGSRTIGNREKGAMTPQQIWGNKIATFLMKLFYGFEFTDLGPFRAISWDKLEALRMKDEDYGWTAEMQVKALKMKYRCVEMPVKYRVRIGTSKVSGTIKGVLGAAYKITLTIFKYL